MSANILGLISSNKTEAYWSNNTRRAILHNYPGGKAPLTYILSLQETEFTDKPQFGWWEKRHTVIRGKTKTAGSLGGGGAGPFANAAGTTSLTNGVNLAVDTIYTAFFEDVSMFRLRDVLWFRDIPNGAGSAVLQVKGIVDSIDLAGNKLTFRTLEGVTAIGNGAGSNGLYAYFTGSAAEENARSINGGMIIPLEVSNFTQIQRTTIGPFSRTQLKEGMKFDSSGIYAEALNDSSLRHMKALELSAFRGTRKRTIVTNGDGDQVPQTTTGGIDWFLRQWELGNTTNGGAFDYRPGEASVVAADWRTTDEKRDIAVNGPITAEEFEMLIERAFRGCADTTSEKLWLCGNGQLTMFHRLVEAKSYRTTQLEVKDAFGMSVTRWNSPWGDLLIKTHPLFNESDAFRNDGYILDTGAIKYRPLNDGDTHVLANRQGNDVDGRKDEIMTEAGYEVAFPEYHMAIRNITDVNV